MTVHSCDALAAKLADYADGELSPAEVGEVAEHVARCPRCRGQLDALRRSLQLARVIWDDNEAELAGVGAAKTSAQRSVRTAWLTRRRTALVAAAVALMIASGLLRQSTRPRPSTGTPDSPAAVSGAPAASPAGQTPPAAAASLRDIEQQIARAGIAAQLLAAGDLLAAQPGGEDIACERYHYIVAAYPNTNAAIESGSRLASVCDERSEQ